MTIETELEGVEVSALHVGRLGKMRYSLSGGVTSSEGDVKIETVQTAVTQPPPFPLVPNFALQPPGGVVAGPFGAQSRTQRRERFALGGELFPISALGIRFDYARWDGDPLRDEMYQLGATWFFKRSIGAGIVLIRGKSGLLFATDDDVDALALQFTGRL